MAEEVRKETEKSYTIQQNEMMALSTDYCERLGWEFGKTECVVFVDNKRGLLYILDKEENISKLPTDRFVCAKPLFGRKFPISMRGVIMVSRHAQNWIGLKVGDKMSQELNLNIHGIVAKKQED